MNEELNKLLGKRVRLITSQDQNGRIWRNS